MVLGNVSELAEHFGLMMSGVREEGWGRFYLYFSCLLMHNNIAEKSDDVLGKIIMFFRRK